jgi:hypothetical protein
LHTPGSFKDLGMIVLVSAVRQMVVDGRGIRAVGCASTGDRSPILAQLGLVHGGIDRDPGPFTYRCLSVGERPGGHGGIKWLKRRDAATAIGDHDGTPAGSVANPAPGREVQFTDGDRRHVHIVRHLQQRLR